MLYSNRISVYIKYFKQVGLERPCRNGYIVLLDASIKSSYMDMTAMFLLQDSTVKFCNYTFSAVDFVAFENVLYLSK